VRPKFTEKVLAAGYELPPELFSTDRIREMRR
jgi:hypothetical protein